ncbi:hypothetical protein PUR71_00675 [Streptomyces sp. SP17BM10]|uniref:hypothetical protein n=1 Tax=Streptomyces sp. SP17BM10 TaxID=3002530 RepID=UPI002E7741B8|nr:hypothetical protein [Streptomyces sp. SP17BM10]MEE1781462.1 hypothetical protein [Streptomyces sp. SP17BM10]
MEWIDPRYADLVAEFRQQDDDLDAVAPYGAPLRRVDGELVPARLGFIVEPLSE